MLTQDKIQPGDVLDDLYGEPLKGRKRGTISTLLEHFKGMPVYLSVVKVYALEPRACSFPVPSDSDALACPVLSCLLRNCAVLRGLAMGGNMKAKLGGGRRTENPVVPCTQKNHPWDSAGKTHVEQELEGRWNSVSGFTDDVAQ